MKRSARAAVLGSVVVAGLLVLGTPLAAQQQNGAIYTQCPGDTNGDGIPDGTSRPAIPTSSACTWPPATASSRWRTGSRSTPSASRTSPASCPPRS